MRSSTIGTCESIGSSSERSGVEPSFREAREGRTASLRLRPAHEPREPLAKPLRGFRIVRKARAFSHCGACGALAENDQGHEQRAEQSFLERHFGPRIDSL